MEIEFSTCSPAPGASEIAPVLFTQTPAPSFGDIEGQSVPGDSADGWVEVLSGISGDCNGDGIVDAGDLAACGLEIFDGDGDFWIDVPGGTFAGNPVGCDANGDTVVDAGDVSCKGLLIFDAGPCMAPTPTTSSLEAPQLDLPPVASMDEQGLIEIAIRLRTHGQPINATAFSLDLGPNLALDDAQGFVVQVPTTLERLEIDRFDDDSEIDILLAHASSTPIAFLDGPLLTLRLRPTVPFKDFTESWIRLAAETGLSFGTIHGSRATGSVTTDEIEIRSSVIFVDDFEVGNTEAWDLVRP